MLKQKLDLLTHKSSKNNATNLSSRLNQLRRNTTENRFRKHVSDEDITQQLSGFCLGQGVVLVEKHLGWDSRHGNFLLKDIKNCTNAFPDCNNATIDVQRLVFCDTETTGLSGGSGTIAFVVGLARFFDNGLQLRQYFLTGFAGEATMLSHACTWLTKDSIFVSFNGKSFDIPLLISRCRLNRLPVNLGEYEHWDLLHHVRRLFSNAWSDCRLQTAEQELLAYYRHDDLVGALVPQVWVDLLRFGDTGRINKVLEHNFWDLVSMVGLLYQTSIVYSQPQLFPVNILSLARFYRSRKQPLAALQLLQQNYSRLDHRSLLELARLYRQQGEWDQAIAIWNQLSQNNCLESIERLAKFHEHIDKNYSVAIHLCDKLISFDSNNEAYQHRYRRLKRRISC